ncbi:hypothetical protein PCANC_21274 [Puccinia coronata f. sp. avenae]|uniref:alpha-1,2-Mannosidase n=1 Tax=Puccinia coronata f. sp. avenae TaxID=200324 RepID=A0A2N5SDW1_9BASI|nr:hypothetical protein PCANC_21274 [Puccinia coronata f. sp. avenae]
MSRIHPNTLTERRPLSTATRRDKWLIKVTPLSWAGDPANRAADGAGSDPATLPEWCCQGRNDDRYFGAVTGAPELVVRPLSGWNAQGVYSELSESESIRRPMWDVATSLGDAACPCLTRVGGQVDVVRLFTEPTIRTQESIPACNKVRSADCGILPMTSRQRPKRSHATTSSGTAGQQERYDSSRSPESAPPSQRNVVIAFLVVAACLLAYYHRLNPTADNSTFSSCSPRPNLPLESDARTEIKIAIRNSWHAYADSPAWGSDEFHPIGQTGTNLTSAGSIGFFIVDVLDTILLTGDMDEEYQRTRKYIENDLSFDVDGDLNAFETTIRVLGGLLSAYHLAGNDTLYLNKAIDLGTRLLPIFDSPTGIPYSFINLKTGKARSDWNNGGYSSLAEATTIQLEFKYLAELSQKRVFWEVAEKAMEVFKHGKSHNGLFPILVSPEDGSFFYHIRLGSRGDSYYEYLIKQYLQTNRTQTVYRLMFNQAMTGVKEDLVGETPLGMVYIGELHPGRSSYISVPKQDHLVCFLGGLLLLGVTEGDQILKDSDVMSLPETIQEDWLLGKELIKSCVDTYKQSSTGLGPEIAYFTTRPEQYVKIHQREWLISNYDPLMPPLDARNILRPETVESLFLAWRATKDPIYREWGWEIFQAFNKHCKVNATGAFASIKDVDRVPPQMEDKMETFWIAETLKYLLLLFSENSVIPLSSYVFNTEAHIFPIFTPSFDLDEG